MKIHMIRGRVEPWEKLPLFLSPSLQKCVSFPSLAHPFLKALMKAHVSFCFSRAVLAHISILTWLSEGTESRHLPGLTSPVLSLFCSHPVPFLLPLFPVLRLTSQHDPVPAGGWEPDSWSGQAAPARALCCLLCIQTAGTLYSRCLKEQPFLSDQPG